MIANGHDEEDFITAEQVGVSRSSLNGCIVLVHSGLLYPSERDPRAFFAAVAELRQAGRIHSSKLKIILRGSGHEDFYRQQLRQNGIEDIVILEASVPYREALVEMLNADGFLIFQASNCNHQIPAKIYEYLRAKRPIFALTDPEGDTAGVLKAAEIGTIVPLDSKEQIATRFLDFLTQVREGCAPIGKDKAIACHSRKSRTEELVKVLDALSDELGCG
jgi:glycosyltransferase involved in cell wall biosynthesis